MMHRYAFLILLVIFSAPAVHAETLACRHLSGVKLFQPADSVQLVRAKSLVTVKVGADEWTYSVVAEDPAFGYRAIRYSPKRGKVAGLDVLLGGELFFITDSGKKKLFVTGSNAASMSSEFGTYVCSN